MLKRIEAGITFNFIKALSIVISIVLVISLIRPVLSEYSAANIIEFNEKDLLLASSITNEDARYHYLLGLLYYAAHDKSGTDQAINRYLLSLKRDPSNSKTWLALARAYMDNNNMGHAEYAVRRAVDTERNNPRIIWEAGVFLLLLNEAEDAIKLFRRYISMLPSEQENVYAICYTMGIEPSYILFNLVPEDYNFYKRHLRFLINNKLLNESYEAWENIKALNPERPEYLSFSDFLLEMGEIESASLIWGDFVKRFKIINDAKPDQNLLWNGDFELEIENGGFDWKIGRADGVRVFRDKDIKMKEYASLSAIFDGKHNPGLYIARQIVPVERKQNYKVTGYIRTENLTTRNGVFIEVAGYKCDPFSKTTEVFAGTNLWRRIELEFTIPDNCTTISVGIKRERSEKFDNKIGGNIWVDSISMTPMKRI
ncbi:MAG: hypothetical protein HZA06_03515 [Nitrospirae bacterium]|nr:hypothetical protein [Nitrospirota bacterium]